MSSRRLRFLLSAAFAGVVLTAMSGLAYAGALPGPAQGVASDVLGKVGVSAPAPHDAADAQEGTGALTSDEAGQSEDTGDASGGETGETGDTGSESTDSSDHGKGKLISELAHSTPAPGKGKIIAPVASGGKSHVGNPPGQAETGDDHGDAHKPDHPGAGGNGHAHGGSGSHGSGS